MSKLSRIRRGAARGVSRFVWRRSPGNVLTHRTTIYTGICPDEGVAVQDVYLSSFGVLTLFAGFEWDGPSGPVVSSRSTMRASAIHDALYSLISEGLIGREHRSTADDILRRVMIEDGASPARAWYFWAAVRLFGWLHV